jgi:hypothetical protein
MKQFEVDFMYEVPSYNTAIVRAESADQAKERLMSAFVDNVPGFEVLDIKELPEDKYVVFPELPEGEQEVSAQQEFEENEFDLDTGAVNAPFTKTVQ